MRHLDQDRLRQAEQSLAALLGPNLKGKSFLDIGCGSGLFSLAARNLGASVTSLDFDPDSVRCAQGLKETFHPDDASWRILQGSVLDANLMSTLGQFDIVYSWGVLHHTGQMWTALAHAVEAVAPGGTLFISIYNDQGGISDRWRKVKQAYVASPKWLRPLLVGTVAVFMQAKPTLGQILRLKSPFAYWRSLRPATRGMTYWYDLVDWVGGYPFEVAKPEEIFNFCKDKGLNLEKLKTCGGGAACNEYVLTKGKQGASLNSVTATQ
ncbi:MAG: class I SAM-dependent methyltransferase [Pseudomonadota bacterium]